MSKKDEVQTGVQVTDPASLIPAGPPTIHVSGGDAVPAGHKHSVFYSEEIAERIVEEFLAGKSFARMCRDNGDFPSQGTISNWIRNHESFAKKIEMACRTRAIFYESEIREFTELGEADKNEMPYLSKKVDALQYLAGVNDPEKYGKRTTVSGDMTRPINIVVKTGIPSRDAKPVVIEVAKEAIEDSGES